MAAHTARRSKRGLTGFIIFLLLAAAIFALWKFSDFLKGVIAPSPDSYSRVTVSGHEARAGDLALVNRANPWDGQTGDLVQVFGFKTGSYSVRDKTVYITRSAMEPLNDMMDAFYDEHGSGDLIVTSCYRDEALQQSLYDASLAANGFEHAERFVAHAGESEHHTGLAVDLGVYHADSGVSEEFDGLGELGWFDSNCADFGFIRRYAAAKEDETGYADEPWHFRYVGEPHAALIEKHGFCLEEYLDWLGRYTFSGEHLKCSAGGTGYEVYTCPVSDVHVPDGFDYTLSGTDGAVVVTVALN